MNTLQFNMRKANVNSLEKKNPDATRLIHINQYNRDKQNLEEKLEILVKIPDMNALVTTTVLNIIISEVENKIPYHDEYTTTPEFNKVTVDNSTARLKQANLLTKIDFYKKLTIFNRKITSNKTKYLEVQRKLNSLITNDYNFVYVECILQLLVDLKTCFFYQ